MQDPYHEVRPPGGGLQALSRSMQLDQFESLLAPVQLRLKRGSSTTSGSYSQVESHRSRAGKEKNSTALYLAIDPMLPSMHRIICWQV